MMPSSSHQVIPIFDGEKYSFWSIKMKTILKTRDLWSVIEQGVPVEPTVGEETPESALGRKKREDAISNDLMALQLLQTAVTDHIFSRIASATTSRDAWETLRSEYEGSAQVRVIKLQAIRREYENLKMYEGEDLKTFTDKLIDLENQLTYHGEKKTNSQIVQKILISLPSQYDSIVSVLEQTRDLDELSMSELIGILKAHEARVLARETSNKEGAFNAQTRNREFGSKRSNENRNNQSKKWCETCKMSNHTNEECWRSGNNDQRFDRSSIKCYNCGRLGHYAKKCRSKRNERASVSIEEEESDDEDHKLFTANEIGTNTANEDTWVVDSGCTNHMTKEEGYFSTIDKSIKVPIKVGNGETIMTEGKGNITVMTNQGKREIQSVFLVPRLEENLLSIPQLISNGYKVQFKEAKCTISNSKGKEIMDIPMTNKSFKIKMKKVREESRRQIHMIGIEEVKEILARDKATTGLVTSRKRKHYDKEESMKKRQKNSTKPISATAFSAKTMQSKKSLAALKGDSHIKGKLDEIDLRRLIVNAQHKIKEKRQQQETGHNEITKKRNDARIDLNKMIASVAFDDHLKYHSELEQLGISFIHDEVKRLKEFNLLSRDDFNDETKYSILKRKKPPWSN